MFVWESSMSIESANIRACSNPLSISLKCTSVSFIFCFTYLLWASFSNSLSPRIIQRKRPSTKAQNQRLRKKFFTS